MMPLQMRIILFPERAQFLSETGKTSVHLVFDAKKRFLYPLELFVMLQHFLIREPHLMFPSAKPDAEGEDADSYCHERKYLEPERRLDGAEQFCDYPYDKSSPACPEGAYAYSFPVKTGFFCKSHHKINYAFALNKPFLQKSGRFPTTMKLFSLSHLFFS